MRWFDKNESESDSRVFYTTKNRQCIDIVNITLADYIDFDELTSNQLILLYLYPYNG